MKVCRGHLSCDDFRSNIFIFSVMDLKYMKIMTHLNKSLPAKQSGVTLIEYALLAALIAIASILMITGVGKSVNNTFSTVNSTLSTTG